LVAFEKQGLKFLQQAQLDWNRTVEHIVAEVKYSQRFKLAQLDWNRTVEPSRIEVKYLQCFKMTNLGGIGPIK
jgi:hypothetical protein